MVPVLRRHDPPWFYHPPSYSPVASVISITGSVARCLALSEMDAASGGRVYSSGQPYRFACCSFDLNVSARLWSHAAPARMYLTTVASDEFGKPLRLKQSRNKLPRPSAAHGDHADRSALSANQDLRVFTLLRRKECGRLWFRRNQASLKPGISR